MIKIVIKEIGIVILLLIAVALLLAIIFYDNIPSNKIVPIKIQAYEVPEDIEEELKEAIPEGQNIVRTYYIDSTDLNSYEATNDYDKGKPNPFAASSNLIENSNNTNTIDNNKQNDDEVYINTPGKNY